MNTICNNYSGFDRYKYILFDLDGTLTESAPGIINSVKHVYKNYGLELPPDGELEAFVGPPLIESFMKFAGMSEDRAREAVDVYREYFSERGLFENAVYDGIPELLSALRDSGHILSVATSKPEVFCIRILEHFDLKKYFSVIKGIPLDGEDMTKAEVIAEALKELGAEPDEAVMIGDRGYDALGAKENALSCVGVLYGYGTRKELEDSGVKAICQTVREIQNLFLN